MNEWLVYYWLQVFFEFVSGCRRRLRRTWQKTPLATIFSLRSEVHLLKHRSHLYRLRLALAQRRLKHREGFALFDSDNKGMVSPGKLWAGLEWLGVPCDIVDVSLYPLLRYS